MGIPFAVQFRMRLVGADFIRAFSGRADHQVAAVLVAQRAKFVSHPAAFPAKTDAGSIAALG